MSKHLIEVEPVHETGKGAGRVMIMSTLAFTLMFAVWLMFGILGAPLFWAHTCMDGGYCDFKLKFAAEPLPCRPPVFTQANDYR